MKSKNNSDSVIPRIGEGVRGVDGYCSYLLRQAAGALRVETDRALEPAGITQPQFMVLAFLAYYPGASGADLARLTQLTPQTLTVITRNLASAKLIQRGTGRRGARQIPYVLTQRGTRLLVNGKKTITEMEARITQGFSNTDIAIVKRWLVEVARRLY